MTREKELRGGSFAFRIVVPFYGYGIAEQISSFARMMRDALDTAEHGPGALELGRWADDGGPCPVEWE